MHGPEKSDSPIVSMKPANKAAQAAAEPMEGRGEAEGNAGLQSTVRTQSRVAVSQAQARIRVKRLASLTPIWSAPLGVDRFKRPICPPAGRVDPRTARG